MSSDNTASKVKKLILVIISKYEKNIGVGKDFYHDTPINHPMADGKYLISLKKLFDGGIISQDYYTLRVKRTLKRLKKSNIIQDEKKYGWGLNFSYKSTTSLEPFIITSSIIAQGLISNQKYVSKEFLSGSINWLNEYAYVDSVHFKNKVVSLAQYSPNIKELNFNAIAYWAKVLIIAEEEKLFEYDESNNYHLTLDYIRSKYVSPYGWKYSDTNNRVDLLHQIYILNSLFEETDLKEFEEMSFNVINTFFSNGIFYDKLDVVNRMECVEIATKLKRYSIMEIQNNQYIVLYDKESRLWSLGELLILTSNLMLNSEQDLYWKKLSSTILDLILKRYENYLDLEQISPRDDMHILDGLSTFLDVLREKYRGQNE